MRLHEISLVAVPADPGAQVTGVKSAQAVLASLRTGTLSPEDRASLVRTLKLLLAKDAACECACPECLDGNCEDCSNTSCDDPNCDDGDDQADQETLSALKQLAAELRGM